MPEQAAPLDTWAIVEVMGHKQFAGHVTEQAIGGTALIRVDVPETVQPDGRRTATYSKLIGPGSIYMITPCTEEVAHAAAKSLERWNNPIPVELPVERRLAAVTADAEVEQTGDLSEDDDDFVF